PHPHVGRIPRPSAPERLPDRRHRHGRRDLSRPLPRGRRARAGRPEQEIRFMSSQRQLPATAGWAPPIERPNRLGLQEMELNFGPQHPSTHGVLRIVLKVDGEKIVSARPDIGYLHRGTEKLFETETYPMGIPHTDRMDYVAAATNNHAFCLAVEKILSL